MICIISAGSADATLQSAEMMKQQCLQTARVPDACISCFCLIVFFFIVPSVWSVLPICLLPASCSLVPFAIAADTFVFMQGR